jgi:hypothetical protein
MILQLFFSGGANPFSTHFSSNSSNAEQITLFSPTPSLLQASRRQEEKELFPSGSSVFFIHLTHSLNGFDSDVLVIKPHASDELNLLLCSAVQLENNGVGPHIIKDQIT